MKGFIAGVINPALLLLDLPNWQLAAGQPLDVNTYKLANISTEGAIRLRYKQVLKRWPNLSQIAGEDHKYFVKEMARVLDLIQRIRTKTASPFSYTKVSEFALSGSVAEMKAAAAIESSRKSKWDYQIFQSNLNSYSDLLAEIKDI